MKPSAKLCLCENPFWHTLVAGIPSRLLINLHSPFRIHSGRLREIIQEKMHNEPMLNPHLNAIPPRGLKNKARYPAQALHGAIYLEKTPAAPASYGRRRLLNRRMLICSGR